MPNRGRSRCTADTYLEMANYQCSDVHHEEQGRNNGAQQLCLTSMSVKGHGLSNKLMLEIVIQACAFYPIYGMLHADS